ncbi:hypothetical protein [Streptomyces sp. NPDC005568]|uniref:hypothetical protein n=1 Tax=Streptomyces sp. NPDC005568 TaxID=3156887 RepID=UPI0033B0957E
MSRVVFVLLPGVHLLDLAGPAQVFSTAARTEVLTDERCDDRLEPFVGNAARRVERTAVGRLQRDLLHGEGRTGFGDPIDGRVRRNV